MEDSVAAHLVADVPISTFLSGGLDSSLITVMAKQHNAEIDSYTISFRDEDQRYEAMPDDFSYAKKVAAEHGIRLHEVEIAPDVADLLPKLVHHLDEPIGDAAAINAYLICQAAREAGVKVLLSGMGADELFGGYRKHYAALLASRYRQYTQMAPSEGHRADGSASPGRQQEARISLEPLGSSFRRLRRSSRGSSFSEELRTL